MDELRLHLGHSNPDRKGDCFSVWTIGYWMSYLPPSATVHHTETALVWPMSRSHLPHCPQRPWPETHMHFPVSFWKAGGGNFSCHLLFPTLLPWQLRSTLDIHSPFPHQVFTRGPRLCKHLCCISSRQASCKPRALPAVLPKAISPSPQHPTPASMRSYSKVTD